MNSTKLVSIIVPVYNVEQYLDRCVESIVNQTYKNLEIILVDDGSPDNCPQICDEWAIRDDRIVVIHKENGGLSDARNAGLEVSKGEFISFVDSDDWVEDTYIESMISYMNNDVDIVSCAVRLCDEDDNTLRIKGVDSIKILNNVDATNSVLSDGDVSVISCSKLYKRSVISDILFEKGKYHEDTFWTWKVVKNANSVCVIEKPLYNYFQRTGSIMGAGYSLKRLDALDSAYEKYICLKDDRNFSATAKNVVVSSCLFNYQSSLKYLSREDYFIANSKINGILRLLDISPFDSDLKSIWYKSFLVCPYLIAKIRSITGIGF